MVLSDILSTEYDATEQLPKWASHDLWDQIMTASARHFNLLGKTEKQLRLFTGLFWNEFHRKTKKLVANETGTQTMMSMVMGDDYPTKKLNLYVVVS